MRTKLKNTFSLLLLLILIALPPGCNSTGATPPIGNTAGNAVSIANFAFSPATLTVKAGTTVTWTNQDSTTHKIASDSGGVFQSGNLAPGDSFSHTFNEAGTFSYHCTPHPAMKGTIMVQ